MIPSDWMLTTLRRVLIALILLFAIPAQADSGLDKNIALLKSAEDFRVRTQAALALGASKSKRAVVPLCHALSDKNRTVRIATATAISRLRKGGEACLKRRLAKEKDGRVLSSLKKALARLGGGGGAEPTIGPDTRIFVAVKKLAGPARLADPVRKAFIKGAKSRKDIGFAPAGESDSDAAAKLKKFPKAKGFLLAPKLSRPKYVDGMLQVKISVAIMTYPGSALVGSFSKTVGMPGVTSQNTEAENELVLLAAEEAMKQFLKLVPSLS